MTTSRGSWYCIGMAETQTLPILTAEDAPFVLKVDYDSDPSSPRDWDNLGNLYLWGRNGTLDQTPAESVTGKVLTERELRQMHETASEDAAARNPKTREDFMDLLYRYLNRALRRFYGEAVYLLRIRGYSHSGTSYRALLPDEGPSYPFNCQWDSGWAGMTWVTRSQLQREYQVKTPRAPHLTRAYQVMQGELDTYTRYCNGEVYQWTVTDTDSDEILESVGGYYSREDAEAEGQYCLNWEREAWLKHQQETQ